MGWFFLLYEGGPRWIDTLFGTPRQYAEVIVATNPRVQITLSDAALVLGKGERHTMKAYARVTSTDTPDFAASDVRVRWVSECPAVASIDASGRITAHSVGVASIRALINNPNAHANAPTCVVTVRESPVGASMQAKGRKVFGGAAVYDASRRTIVFTATRRFTIYSPTSAHAITMHRGDYISDAYVVDGTYLIAGRFVKGSSVKTIEGIAEEL